MLDNALPAVSRLLQHRYLEARRRYLTEHPELAQWKRRSSKRKPIPGLYEAPYEAEG